MTFKYNTKMASQKSSFAQNSDQSTPNPKFMQNEKEAFRVVDETHSINFYQRLIDLQSHFHAGLLGNIP